MTLVVIMVIGHNMDDVEPGHGDDGEGGHGDDVEPGYGDDGEAGWVGQGSRCKLLPSGAIPNPRVCAHNMPRNRDHARDHHNEASP